MKLKNKIFVLFYFFTLKTCFSQTICNGQIIVPVETFNISNTNPWVLVFEDNFNGNSLDLSVWNPKTGVPRDFFFDNQKAWHKPENIIVENDLLKIISKDEQQNNMPVVTSWNPYTVSYEDFDYTSGEMWTKKKFLYGKFEARIKIPKGKGFWPAFWLYGGSVWNEIDIFEFWNEDDIIGNYDPSKLSKVHHMNVWLDYNSNGNVDDCGTKYTGTDFSQDFHIFTLIWEKDKIEWLVDGVSKRVDYKYYTVLGQITGPTINAFQQYIINKIYPKEPMSIILNTAIQTGSGSPDISTLFPSQMEVDWVKYYQKKECNNINIISANDFLLDDEVNNAIVGENVNVNCNYIVNNNIQLEIIADKNITLDPGFEAVNGSEFNAKINSDVCQYKTINIDTVNLNYTAINNINSFENLNTIKIFPNPNNGSFILDIGFVDFKNYSVIIYDINGSIITKFEEINSSTLKVDISEKKKGIYFLKLINNIELNESTHKLIIQ